MASKPTVKATKKNTSESDEKQSVLIEVEEIGPNSMFGFAQHVADFGPVKIGGKTFNGDVCSALVGGSVCVDLQDDTTYPEGPMKSRRIVFNLRALVNAAITHIEANPVPKNIKRTANSSGKVPKIWRTF